MASIFETGSLAGYYPTSSVAMGSVAAKKTNTKNVYVPGNKSGPAGGWVASRVSPALAEGYEVGSVSPTFRNKPEMHSFGSTRQPAQVINGYNYELQQTQVDPAATLQNLLGEYVSSYNTGRAVNEQRYADILSGYRDRYSGSLSLLEGMGDTQKAALNQQYDKLSASTNQDAISRGLGNTTVRDSLKRGVEADRAVSQNALAEQVRKQKLDYQTALSGDTLKFMTDRNDSYPTLDQIGNIALSIAMANKSKDGGS